MCDRGNNFESNPEHGWIIGECGNVHIRNTSFNAHPPCPTMFDVGRHIPNLPNLLLPPALPQPNSKYMD